ncbi:MAG: MerC domain-containing protein [Gammaproteobacteria bacterium]
MQKIIDNLGITVSSVCAIHCVLLPAIFIIAPYSFLASHEFHEALIYFILPCAAIAFVLGCRKHGDVKVAIMGTLGVILLASSLLFHDIFHAEEHSEELITVIITIAGSVMLILSHLRNRKLCLQEDYACHE